VYFCDPDSIAANVETAETNVTQGNVQLQQARQHQVKYERFIK